ncbi:MAG: group I intron-associated PD-(D/E)XK endonuclease [Nitriliruptor sp.]|uniref:group I intron-associated PD-(D/E)XK endonuclease n=1 Tax=Nitriliruptor sp. TaxID=2448056 RepID=UPI0034A00BB3
MHEPQLDLGTEPAPADHAVDHQAAHLAKADRRPADTLWRANPREQGLLGLTDAIAFFGAQGWSISLPLIDSQPYDLIVDDGTRLQRVQVKTTTYRSRDGVFVVSLATRGGNQSFHTSKDFDPTSCELLYVLTDARTRYLIPAADAGGRTTINLGERYASYRLRG